MKKFDIVILTDSRYVNPSKTDWYIDQVLLEDDILLKALEKEGLVVSKKNWADKTFDWESTKYAIFRTTWDYFERFHEFFTWIEETKKKTNFINSQEIINWNIDKHYLKDLEENEKKLFLDEYNIKIGGLSKLIEKSYEILNLITYYTAGPEESRAWSIIRDTKAPNAAGKIHTDFEKGFIRAEIIEYEDFIKCGSEEESKSKGLMRSEGKDYLVKDGDIIHFRYNV